MKGRGDHKGGRPLIMLAGLVLIILVLYYFSPEKGQAVVESAWRTFLDVVVILPPVVLLMGLFEVWVPQSVIERYLGQKSGVTGIVLSLVAGSAPTGPLYIAFPIAAGLVQKGARLANVVIFLGAWAAAKLPQIMVEAKFVGISFALLRLVLTVITVVASGFVMEFAHKAGRRPLTKARPESP